MIKDAVYIEILGDIAVLTLNRPNNRNSMTPELLAAFTQSVKAICENRKIRVAIITGNGNCFSAGADFRSQIQSGDQHDMPHERSLKIYQPFLSVLQIEVPVIAALNGHAVGGGFGLAMACDIRIAHTNSKYGVNFCKLGITPGMGLTASLPNQIGYSKASELFFTGKLFSGEEGQKWGVFSSVYKDKVKEHCLELAAEVAQSAPLALKMTKKILSDTRIQSIRRAAQLESLYQSEILQTNDAQEGMTALLEKRAPSFRGE